MARSIQFCPLAESSGIKLGSDRRPPLLEFSDDGWPDQVVLSYSGPDTGENNIVVPSSAFVPEYCNNTDPDPECFECFNDNDCDDSNPCTDNTCVDGYCLANNNTATCDDGNSCTMNDVCSFGFCIGLILDADSDTYGSSACGGNDCDDNNAAVNPGIAENCSNGGDDDCDGVSWNLKDTNGKSALSGKVEASLCGKNDHTPFAFNHAVDFTHLSTVGAYTFEMDGIKPFTITVSKNPV